MSNTSMVMRRAEHLLALVPKGLIRFLAVGMGGLFVDQSVLWTSEHFGMPFVYARAFAIAVATCFTWALNRRFTFGDSGRSTHHEIARYFGVAFVAQSVNYGVSILIATRMPHLPHPLVAFVGAVVATLFSYSGQRFFTFAPSKPDASLD